ncbi:MAG: DMT family transporter [Pseudomonadota bacterium]
MAADRPILGIALMLGFCVTVPVSDAFAKLAGDALPLAVLVFARFVVQAALTTPLALASGGLRIGRRLRWLSLLRTVSNLLGLGVIYASFRVLPLADAIAIAYVLPFILLFLGHFLMGETVGAMRILAACVGFVGTLMVIQPSFAAVGLLALLPVLGAIIFAVFVLVTRVMAKSVGAVPLQAISGLQGSALMLLVFGLGAATGWQELRFAMPELSEVWLLLGLGLVGSLAHLFMAMSLRYAPVATVAPVQYLEIPMAAIVGLVVFGDFPNGLALVGMAVILMAGLFILWRERRSAVLEGPAAPSAAEG